MPSLNFVLPHWLYWAGLLLFPLGAMYIVRRSAKLRRHKGVQLPIAYLFWFTGGFLGLHRFYLRSMVGLVYLPLFVFILFGNIETREARQIVSNARSEEMSAEFLVERAQQQLDEGRADAQARLDEAKQALTAARETQTTTQSHYDRWQTINGSVAGVVALLMLIDALLLPGMTRRQAEREGSEAVLDDGQVTEPVEAGTHEDPSSKVHTRITDVIDRINGFAGEFVCYWSLIAVFVYYYEVLARYVFNSPTNWAHESMFLMFGAQYLLSGAFAYREDAHVRVDVVYLMFPDRMKVIVDIFTSIFFFIFIVALLWTGWTFARDSASVWEVSFTEWAIQYWPIKLSIPVGAFLLLLQGIAKLLKDIHLLRTMEA